MPDLTPYRQAEAAVRAAVASLEDEVPKEHLEVIEAAAKQTIEAIKDARPEVRCPFCFGKGCKFCFNTGYVSKSRLALVPKELLNYA